MNLADYIYIYVKLLKNNYLWILLTPTILFFSYPQHCKVETRCHMLYQTVCEDSSYGYGGQTCGSVPREHCYPETKCHRTPMTQCKPVQKEKCVKVPREVIVQKVQKQCLPFEVNQAELDAQANIDPCAQQGYGVGAPGIILQSVNTKYY